MTEIDFDELEKKAEENVKNRKITIENNGGKEPEAESKVEGLFSDWTPKPFIIGGIVLAVLIIATIIFINI